MVRFLYPQIKKADLFTIFKCAIIGAVAAGLYGIIHDQITFTISPEYFTNLKFKQFQYVDFGFGDRIFVAVIGFMATWWVGLFIGWCFGRRFVPNQPRDAAIKDIRNAFVIVLVSAAAFAFIGFIYGHSVDPAATLAAWSNILRSYNVADGLPFITVAYIHNASYAGALFGLIAAFIIIRPKTSIASLGK